MPVLRGSVNFGCYLKSRINSVTLVRQEVKMVDKTVPEDIKKMSFEDALHELEKIVGGLEQGAGKLDEAIGAYERGTSLGSIAKPN